ncbi:MAG: hypothetical protein CSH36_15170 [Thalassolituus sp.]|nr:MAG: hypothetical protein CSH36_15170 [Thalassolituus sp.]
MELMGLPHRIVISDRGLEDGTIEYKNRRAEDKENIPAGDIISFLKEKISL